MTNDRGIRSRAGLEVLVPRRPRARRSAGLTDRRVRAPRPHRPASAGVAHTARRWTSRSPPPRPSSATAPARTSSTPCSRSRRSSSATTPCPDETIRELKRLAIEARLHGGSLPVAAGGQGWSAIEQVLVHEQLGQATGGLWSFIPGAYNALVHCTPEQRRRYLDPSLRGERNGSYAITEAGQGSDARTLASTAVRDAGHRGVGPQRREVVRDRAVGHRLHDLPLPRARGRRAAAHAVPRRLRRARPRHDRRPGLHPHVRRPPPAVHAHRRPGDRRRAAGRRGRGGRDDQRVVRRGAAAHRGPLRRRDGAPADARGRVGDEPDPVRRSGSTTSRA